MHLINPFWAGGGGGGGTPTIGTLVVELLFEDGGGTSALNTGTLGGTYAIAGAGAPASIVPSGGFNGGYLSFGTAFDAQYAASDSHPPELIIGTADLEISAYAFFGTYSSRHGMFFWGWDTGSTSPALYMEPTTGKLRFTDSVSVDIDSGYTIPLDATWRQYKLRRVSGAISVLVDDVVQSSFSYASNCNVGFNTGSFRVGSSAERVGGFSDAGMDEFRFYNGNV